MKILKRERLGNRNRDKRQHLAPRKKEKLYARQSGRCAICQESFPIYQMEADHINPDRQDFNAPGNWQLLCLPCNREKAATSVMNQTKKYNKTAVEIIGDKP